MASFKIYTRAVIFDSKGRIAIIKKRPNQKIAPGKLLLPGGTVEFGEAIEASIIREIKEEINLDVTHTKLLGLKTLVIEDTHWLGVYYLAETSNADQIKNMEPEKHTSAEFINPEKMTKSELPDPEILSLAIQTYAPHHL